jgi:RNA polymerase sigma-70 factor, ECF subfamily
MGASASTRRRAVPGEPTAAVGLIRDRPSGVSYLRGGPWGDPSGDDERVYHLVARARGGDREALGELYERYSDQVFRCVDRILRDAHESEDVTQHVFLKLMSVLPRYERRVAPFSAWLMRVARNVALDTERKRRAVSWEDVPEPERHDDDHYQRGRSLREALASLPEAQRRVILLRHVAGFSAPEIAAALGKTAGSVHALDQRGRRALKGDLLELGSGPATRERAERATSMVA